MNRFASRLGLTALALVAGAVPLVAQVVTGSVSGIVRGEGGTPIVGARITLKTGQGDRAAITNANGTYRFGLLTPGNVKVVVSADGFISASVDTRVNIDKNSIFDINLKKISQTGATVEVVAARELVNATEATVQSNVTLSEINALPINTRDITTIAQLSPGTSADANGLTIRGSMATQVQYLVDGADIMDPVTGGPSVRLNEEMLEEVQVITGAASAEYGRFTGGVVNTVTKSGSNEFAGTIRWDVTNNKWNARNPKNDRSPGNVFDQNHANVIQQYFASGPIWKDHIFFVVGYRTTSPMGSVPGTTQSPDVPTIGFATTRTEERKDIKIDYQINPSHKVFYQYNKTESKRKNIDYASRFGSPSTSIATLSSQNDEFAYSTYGYNGMLLNNLVLEVRVNDKKETLGKTGGGQGPKNAPMWFNRGNGSDDAYDNGYFADGGDSRPVKGRNISMTWFPEWMGTHEIKGGYQWFQSQRNSANAQTPSNYMIYFNDFITRDANGMPTSIGVANRALVVGDTSDTQTYMEWWQPITGATTKNTINSYFINDKWKLNNHWAFNIGIRYDNFKSQDDLGRDNFNIKGTSPRLSAIWDVQGNAKHVLSFNYAVYLGQVIQGATDSTSPAGNPIQRKYSYLGGAPLQADGSINLAAWSSTPYFVDDPFLARTTSTNKGMKPPKMTEYQVTYKYDDSEGGIWGFSASKRKWTDMVEDFKQRAADGQVYTVIQNDPNARRDYFGIELAYDKRVSERFNVGMNATLSTLKGNMEGGQVGTNGAQNNFGNSGAIPVQYLAPYGFLQADSPLSLNASASYTLPIGKGKLNFSSIGYFESGAPYSLTATATKPTSLPSAASYGTYTRFYGDRGIGRYPNTYRADFQVGYEVPMWRKLTAFARVNVRNVFNSQQLDTFNISGTTMRPGTGADAGKLLPGGDAANVNTGTFVGGSSFGRPTGAAHYITARTINIAGGFRF